MTTDPSKKTMKLKLDQVKAKDLENTGGIFDAQDPMLIFTIAKQVFKTERKKDAKTEASFDAASFELDIDAEDYETGEIKIAVEAINAKDDGSTKAQIGKAEVDLKSVILPSIIGDASYKHTDISIPLTHFGKKNKSKQKGVVTFRAVLEKEREPEPKDEVLKKETKPENPQDSNNPITDPVKPSKSVQPVPNSPAPAAITVDNKAEKPAAASPSPVITATDNNIADIGKTRPNPSGKITKTYKMLRLKLEKLSARGLLDTGSIFDGQDPSVTIKIAGQEFVTERKKDCKKDAVFEAEFETADFAEVSYLSAAQNFEIEVAVNNCKEDGTVKAVIGTGKVALRDVIPVYNVPTPITIELLNNKGKKGSAGVLQMEGTLIDPSISPPNQLDSQNKTEDLANDPGKSAQEESLPTQNDGELMKLKLDKIHAKDLYDTGWFLDGQDPAVTISLVTYRKIRNLDPNQDGSRGTSGQVRAGATSAVKLKEGRAKADFLEEEKVFTTVREKDQKTEALFPETFFAQISETAFFADDVEIQVIVNNVTEDGTIKAQIGVGRVNLRHVLPVFNKSHTITIPLTHYKHPQDPKHAGNDGELNGVVTIRGLLESKNNKSAEPSTPPASSSVAAGGDPKKDGNSGPDDGEQLTKPFQFGELSIKRIVCKDLPNVESFTGKNDPFVVLQLGNERRETEPIEEGGNNVVFDYLDIKFDVEKYILDFELLHVKLVDDNTISADKEIGVASVSLKSLVSDPFYVKKRGQVIELPPLTLESTAPAGTSMWGGAGGKGGKKGPKPAGTVILFVQLDDRETRKESQGTKSLKTIVSGLPATDKLPQIQYSIKRIRAFDLRNSEALFDDAVDSPYVALKLVKVPQNAAKKDGDDDDDAPAAKKSLRNLKPELLEKNIGQWGARTPTLQMAKSKVPIFDHLDLATTLTHDQIYAGHYVQLDSSRAESGDQEGLATAALSVSSRTSKSGRDIGAKSDLSVPLIDKFVNNDPYKLFVTVYNDNTMLSDTLIGSGYSHSLTAKLVRLGEVMELAPIELVAQNGASVGRVVLYVELTDPQSARAEIEELPSMLDLALPQDFEAGYLHIKSIDGHPLRDVRTLGEQDPFVRAFFGGTQFLETPPHEDGGANCHFENIVAKCKVDKKSIFSDKLSLSVADRTSFNGEKFIGTTLPIFLKLPALSIGKDVKMVLNLYDDKAMAKSADGVVPKTVKKSGRIEIVCNLSPIPNEKDLKIDPNFKRGFVKINRIVTTQIKSGNFLSKPAAFVQVTYEGVSEEKEEVPMIWSGKTPVADDYNFAWEFLGMRSDSGNLFTQSDPNLADSSVVLTPNTVHTNAMVVELREGKKILGVTKIQNLMLAGTKLDTEVEISADLYNYKPAGNAKSGKIGQVIPSSEIIQTIGDKPIGQISLFLEIKNEEPKIKQITLKQQEENEDLVNMDGEKPTFEDGLLLITQIKGKELKNTDLFGKADPYVILSFGDDWQEETKPLDNAGCEVIWSDLKYQASITWRELLEERLHLAVYDKNDARRDVLIGSGAVSIKKLGFALKREVQFSVDIKDGSNKTTGKIEFTAELHENPDSGGNRPKLPDSFRAGVLQVVRIRTFQLKNTEFFGDKQDPYVVVKLGDFRAKTHTIQDGGGDVLFDLLDIRTKITPFELETKKLEIEVWDENTLGDKLIGVGKISVLDKKITQLDQEIELQVNLKVPPAGEKNKPTKDKTGPVSGEFAGRVILFVKLRDAKDVLWEEEQARSTNTQEFYDKLPIVDNFERGRLVIRKIGLFGMANTEFFAGLTKQDPYVEVSLMQDPDIKSPTQPTAPYPVWSATTPVNYNAGKDVCIWDFLDMKCPINARSLLCDGALRVTVKNDNQLREDSLIGVTGIRIKPVGAKFNTTVDLTGHLRNPSIKNRKEGGEGVLSALSDTFSSMFGSATGRTGKSDGKVGKSGETAPNGNIFVESTHFPGGFAGKIVVYAELQDPNSYDENDGEDVDLVAAQDPKTYNLPESFQFGILKITRIDAFQLRNTELFGGKQDPFVVVQVGTGETALPEQRTDTKNNSGENVSWDVLPLEFEAYRSTILQRGLGSDCPKPLLLSVYDENTSRKNALIGVGRCSLRKCVGKTGAGNIDRQVELEVRLCQKLEDLGTEREKSGKSFAGKLVVFATLCTPEAEVELPESFEQGELRIKRVAVFGLKNTEMLGFGNGDPYVRLKIDQYPDSYTQDTLPLDNAGVTATWDYLDFSTMLAKKTVKIGYIVAEVWDKNSIAKDRLIGSARIPLNKAVTDNLGTKDKEIVADLHISGPKMGDSAAPDPSNPGKKQGKVSILVKLIPKAAPPKKEMVGLPADFKAGVLKIIEIKATGLRNTELLGKQDPYVKLSVGDFWDDTTDSLDNAGSSACWNALEIETEITRELLQREKLCVEVLDENTTRSDRTLGRGIVSFAPLCANLNNPTKISVDLANGGGIQGNLDIVAALLEGSLEEMDEIGVPEEQVTAQIGPKGGILCVRKITGRGIRGGRSLLGGKHDAFVCLGVNDWSGKTPPQKRSKEMVFFGQNYRPSAVSSSNADQQQKKEENWADSLETAVSRDAILYQPVRVQVKCKNELGQESVISLGEGSLKRTAVEKGKDTILVVRLKDTERGRPAGSVELLLNIQETPDSPPKSREDAPISGAGLGVINLKDCAIILKSSPKDSTLGKMASFLTTGGSEKQEFSLFAKLKIGDFWAMETSQSVIKSTSTGASAATSLVIRAKTEKIAVAQLQKYGILVHVFSTKQKAAISGQEVAEKQGDLVGITKISLDSLLRQPREFVSVKGDMKLPKGGGETVGRVKLHASFTPLEGDGSREPELDDVELFGEPPDDEMAKQFESVSSQQLSLAQKVGDMENQIISKLEQDLAAERKSLLDAMAAQNKELKASIQNLADALSDKKKPNTNGLENLLEGLVLHKAGDLKLPQDPKSWRNAHVQAWVAFRMELPQYMDSFQQASVDGLVLLNYLDADVLQGPLGVEDRVHRQKLLEGIQRLRIQEQKLHAPVTAVPQIHKKPPKKPSKRGEEHHEKKPKKSKSSKGKKSAEDHHAGKTAPPQTFFGSVREENIVERAKIEQEMKQFREAKRKRDRLAEKKSKTWGFEYTGEAAAPPVQGDQKDVWASDEDPLTKALGSRGYSKTMQAILSSAEFSNPTKQQQQQQQQQPQQQQQQQREIERLNAAKAPGLQKIRPIPRNCSDDEVLAVVKGAMYEVSNWLRKIESINLDAEAIADSDLQFPENTQNSNEKGVENPGIVFDPFEFPHNSDGLKRPTTPNSGNEDQKDGYYDPPPPDYASLLAATRSDAENLPKTPPPSYADLLNTIGETATGRRQNEEERTTTTTAAAASGGTSGREGEGEQGNVQGSVDEENGESENDGDSVSNAAPAPAPRKRSSAAAAAAVGIVDGEHPHADRPQGEKEVEGEVEGEVEEERDDVEEALRAFEEREKEQQAEREKRLDRVSLVFQALVGQSNNNAAWLGKNNKLTRLKLSGGIASLLRLKLDWSQFDSLWTKLDYKRSGDLDLEEFRAFFGDLSEFEETQGANALTSTTTGRRNNPKTANLPQNSTGFGTTKNTSQSAQLAHVSVDALTKCLYEMCDVLRNAGFTVVEMFSGFDRNGSGDVSIAEFGSMLRLIVGSNFMNSVTAEATTAAAAATGGRVGSGRGPGHVGKLPGNSIDSRKLIYQALSVLDADGDKKISLNELLQFVYRVWKTQLDDLAEKIHVLDGDSAAGSGRRMMVSKQEDARRRELLQRERASIKDAIKKNFPRAWRDKLERAGAGGHAIPGPFVSLLHRMGILAPSSFAAPPATSTEPYPANNSTTNNYSRNHPKNTGAFDTFGDGIGENEPYPSDGHHATAPAEVFATKGLDLGEESMNLVNPRPPQWKSATQRANAAGRNQLLRVKIRVPTPNYGPFATSDRVWGAAGGEEATGGEGGKNPGSRPPVQNMSAKVIAFPNGELTRNVLRSSGNGLL